jgi:hypothetical protein
MPLPRSAAASRAMPAGGSHGLATGGKMSSMDALCGKTGGAIKGIPLFALS